MQFTRDLVGILGTVRLLIDDRLATDSTFALDRALQLKGGELALYFSPSTVLTWRDKLVRFYKTF